MSSYVMVGGNILGGPLDRQKVRFHIVRRRETAWFLPEAEKSEFDLRAWHHTAYSSLSSNSTVHSTYAPARFHCLMSARVLFGGVMN